jgi:glutamate-ammonia-ligase adenylyltransferase
VSSGKLPPALAQQAERAWQQILDCAGDELGTALVQLAQGEVRTQLFRVLGCSPFAADLCRRRPALLEALLGSGEIDRPLQREALRDAVQAQLGAPGAELEIVLRRVRQRHMLRILWRDFCRLADTLETVRDVSLLAEVCIELALAHCSERLLPRYGRPIGQRSGEPQQLIVLAMGKLGAGELNLSSDIDLIFAYPEAGRTEGGRRSLSNEEYFIKLGQALISALDQVTVEGFVFRVDMRLRPYGDSGALVHNFAALEQYYEEQGRDWERYALIKARPVTGDPAACRRLMASLRPFIYRRYIDYGVIESLRGMKQMINAEVRRRGLEGNVKLGHGGIREVEFIAQCLQLIRGGRDLGLQQRELLPVLEECVRLGSLPQDVVQELSRAYLFLRDSEHAIQGYRDRQTQELPQDEAARLALAAVMGFENWEQYLQALQAHRERVARHFQRLIADPEAEEGEEDEEDEAHPTLPPWDDSLDAGALAALGFRQPEESLQRLTAMRHSSKVVNLQAEGRDRLEEFMPRLLLDCAGREDPDLALQRLLPLVVAVLRRSVYLALLLENPMALDELVMLCEASPWIAEQMARSTVLLDELLDRAELYTAPDKALLQQELRQQVARLAEDDLEAQMEALRYFKAAQVLHVAASELTGHLPVMKVSDKLTWIAEAILEQVLAVAWADLTRKYGEPGRDSGGRGFAVFGYGKLGGIELGYSSDLDLLFVSDAVAQGSTNGERSIDNTVFYTRLGQRMIHILETRTGLGQLYEADMRLRPSGESGMLVSSLEGFRNYQRDSAWTWEHQALVRARFVAGDPALGQRIDRIRREILCLPREQDALAREVLKMRARMQEHLWTAASRAQGFHLKHAPGGIVDIEFMVQYAVLRWAAQHPALADWTDNVRILETLEREALLPAPQCRALTGAYLAFRGAAHQLALQHQPGIVPEDRFAQQQAAVVSAWQAMFAPWLEAGEA